VRDSSALMLNGAAAYSTAWTIQPALRLQHAATPLHSGGQRAPAIPGCRTVHVCSTWRVLPEGDSIG
jgi:hypothetical protein